MAGNRTSKALEEKSPVNSKLVDILSEGTVQLVEGSGEKSGRTYVRGEFGRADKATANKRLYPPEIWESEIKRLKGNLKERKVLGELDHPADGRTSLQRASHVVTDITLKDGRVIGEAEILNTQMGRDLKAIFEAGVPVGISSRGYGSVKENDKGESVVQQDYRLVTFDFVAEPADSTAYPNVFFEGIEIPTESVPVEERVDDTEMAKRFAARVLADKPAQGGDQKEQLAAEFLAKLAEIKTQLRDQVRAELLADPAIGRARDAVSAVREAIAEFLLDDEAKHVVAAKDAEIALLKKRLGEADASSVQKDELIEKLSGGLKEAGYRFHMERLIGEDPDAESIRRRVGDVTKFANVKALNEAIDSVREKLGEQREEAEEAQRELNRREEKLSNQNAQLQAGLAEALGVNKKLMLMLYANQRLTNHPEAEKIRAMLEHVQLESKQQVDELLEQWRTTTPGRNRDADDLQAIRARVRSKTQGGHSPLNEDEDNRAPKRGPSSRDSNYLGLGAPLSELKRLSGLHE